MAGDGDTGTLASGGDVIGGYARAQSPKDGAICHALRDAIEATLPKATSKIWHRPPVWFIGENPVVGYNVTPKHVNLLFWSGQSFGEPGLKAAAKFAAAQVQLSEVSQIDPKTLRHWLKKAGTNIFDYRGHFARQRASQKKANQ